MKPSENIEDIDAADRNAAYHSQSDKYGVWSVPGLMAALPDDERATFRILEIGCCYGHSSAAVKARYPNANVVAGDVVQECLEKAKKQYPELETAWLNADRALPFEDEGFDFVFSSNLYEHLHDDASHLREVRRVLRPGGAYIISTPNMWFDVLYWGLIQPELGTRFVSIWSRLTRSKRSGHCNLQTIGSLTRRLERAGFTPRVQSRGDLSNTELEKLAGMLRWLPPRTRERALTASRSVWRRLPPAVQPSIVVIGQRSP